MSSDQALNEDSLDSTTHGRVTQARSVRLTADVIDRLNALCDHLGITPGAYMTAAIGKCLAQDEVSFHIKRQTARQMDGLTSLMSLVSAELENKFKE